MLKPAAGLSIVSRIKTVLHGEQNEHVDMATQRLPHFTKRQGIKKPAKLAGFLDVTSR